MNTHTRKTIGNSTRNPGRFLGTSLATSAAALITAAGLAAPAASQSGDSTQPDAQKSTQKDAQRDDRQSTADVRSPSELRTVYNFQKMSSILGSTVESMDDTELATIEDLVFDSGSGKISHVVVLANDFLGLGGDRLAIPYEAFRVSLKHGTFLLPVTDEQAENFGELVPAGWTRFESGDIESEIADLNAVDRNSYPTSLSIAMRDDPDMTTLEGTVDKLHRSHYAHGGQMMTLDLRTKGTDGGDSASTITRNVVLGPTWYLTSRENPLQRGERVSIEAVELSDSEATGFAATHIARDRGDIALWTDDGNKAWDDDRERARTKQYIAASEILDALVRSHDDSVGDFDDAVIETGSGMVAMLMLDPNDNLLGIGDELKCVPWDLASFYAGTVALDASSETLEKCQPMPENVTIVRSTAPLEPIYGVVGLRVAEFPLREYEHDLTPSNTVVPRDRDTSMPTRDREQKRGG